MITSFRFNSPWEQFEKSALREPGLLVGYMKDLDIYIDEAAEETLTGDVLNIIHDEILYLIDGLLEMEGVEEDEIKEAFTESGREDTMQKCRKIIERSIEVLSDWSEIQDMLQLNREFIEQRLPAMPAWE